MKQASIITVITALLFAPSALAGTVHLSWVSQQYGSSAAAAGAEITVRTHRPGHDGERGHAAATSTSHSNSSAGGSSSGTASIPQPVLYPTLPASSPSLMLAHPRGPGTFWYLDGSGHLCVYVPIGSGLCYTVSAGASAAAAVTPLQPASVAARVAEQFALTPGQIRASPSNVGLTGAPSWFWLDPAPATEQRSISLAGESVTVAAVPQVEWQFGDGTTLDGGPGVPYQPGTVPADAITHSYSMRCLPGDQGHDPYVLPSCGDNGYQLTAAVTWQISYRAEGPVAETGTLPTRTTSSATAYPVTEARAFLVSGNSP